MIYAMMVVGTIFLGLEIIGYTINYTWPLILAGALGWVIYDFIKTEIKQPQSKKEDDKDDKTPPKDPPKLYTGAI